MISKCEEMRAARWRLWLCQHCWLGDDVAECNIHCQSNTALCGVTCHEGKWHVIITPQYKTLNLIALVFESVNKETVPCVPFCLRSLSLSLVTYFACIVFPDARFAIPQGYFSECLFIILSFARLLPPPHAITSYFLNWLSSSFPLLTLECPFLSKKLTLLNCFLFRDNQKPLYFL